MPSATQRELSTATNKAAELVMAASEPGRFFPLMNSFLAEISPAEVGLLFQCMAMMAYAGLEILAELDGTATPDAILLQLKMSMMESPKVGDPGGTVDE